METRLNPQAIQEILETALILFPCAGISLTLTEDGIHRSFNAGMADLERGIPMTEDTILPIGSSSKAFTAEAVCLLADRGLLRLDEPVKTYLPELRMYDWYAQERLTVRDLLCHRCGLPRHDFLWYARETDTEEELMRSLPHLKPFASFREKYHYNNLMFAVAGLLIERVDGRPWAQFVAEELVNPLGVERVSFSVEEMKREKSVAVGYGYARQSGKLNPLPYKQLHGIRAAGAINASTAQMVKWIDLQLNLGKVGERHLLREDGIRECHTPQTLMGAQPLTLPGNDFACYGLGWMMQRCKGRKLVHHGGNIDGFAAMHFFLPEEKLGASILTNSNSSARSAVMYALVDLLLGEDWNGTMQTIRTLLDTQEAELDAARKSRLKKRPQLSPAVGQEVFCGVYDHPGYGRVTVDAEGGTLMLSIGSFRETLRPLSQGSFELETQDEAVFGLQFVWNLDGQVAFCDIDLEPMTGELIRFVRQPPQEGRNHV